ncbi:hypothetical protein D5S17_28905 [Pseudonocardiaceae bacterium YIM PH 21723]|nr:hypothetical protein D5S17_28905 [Pseudonocardiaceae bacterium YIM PH 21723]
MFGAGLALVTTAATGLGWEAWKVSPAGPIGQAEKQKTDELHERDRRYEESTRPRIALPQTPPAVVQAVHRAVVNRSTQLCRQMSPAGQVQFAAMAKAADCDTAIPTLADQISQNSVWVQPKVPPGAVTSTGTAATVDTCGLRWFNPGSGAEMDPPGPRIGRLVMEHQDGVQGNYAKGWLITGVEPC